MYWQYTAAFAGSGVAAVSPSARTAKKKIAAFLMTTSIAIRAMTSIKNSLRQLDLNQLQSRRFAAMTGRSARLFVPPASPVTPPRCITRPALKEESAESTRRR
jgi:hypothetical protein